MAKKILLLIGAAVLLAGAGIWAYSSSTTRNSETGAPAMMGCGGGKCGVVKDTPACAEAHAGQCEEGQEGCGGCGGGGCGAGGCGQGGCGQGGCGRTAQPQAGPAPARAETSCCPK